MALVSLSARPSVRRSVCLWHSCSTPIRTVQHIEMPSALYDRAMLGVRFLCGSWASCWILCHCFGLHLFFQSAIHLSLHFFQYDMSPKGGAPRAVQRKRTRKWANRAARSEEREEKIFNPQLTLWKSASRWYGCTEMTLFMCISSS